MTNVVFEEANDEDNDNEPHILFTFGEAFFPSEEKVNLQNGQTLPGGR